MTGNPTAFDIRPVGDEDRQELVPFLLSFWHSERMVARGRLFHPTQQEGFLARMDGKVVGLITYEVQGNEMEIALLDSRERGQGLGTALIEQALEKGRQLGCRRIWAVTTNDNIRAFRFYQKRGFDLVKVHRNAVATSRQLKPEIPLTGQEGIPIRHEVEFELLIQQA